MENFDISSSTDAGDVDTLVRGFHQALLRSDAYAVAALCIPTAKFTVECGEGVPVVTSGPHTFTALYAPRPGLTYVTRSLVVHPSPGGAVAVWRVQVFGGGGERFMFGVSAFYLRSGRFERVDTTYMPAEPRRRSVETA